MLAQEVDQRQRATVPWQGGNRLQLALPQMSARGGDVVDRSVRRKAEVDPASPAKVEAARALASDPGSPGRALTAFGEDWAVSPTECRYAIADEPPRVPRAASRAESGASPTDRDREQERRPGGV